MAKTQDIDDADAAEPAGEAEGVSPVEVPAEPVSAATQAPPAAQEAPALLPPETKMPMILCSTCMGVGCVRHGGRMYMCPTCKGAKGRTLGARLQDDTALTIPAVGASRASAHLARGMPNSIRIGRRR